MDDSLYDDPITDERLLPPEERQQELLQTNDINTLGDVVDAHGAQSGEYDLDVTTRGIDPADLKDEDPLDTVVGYAGNFSNDGMAGARVDDALSPDMDDPGATLAGEYDPNESDFTPDMTDNLRRPDEMPASRNDQEVLSSGVGHVRPGESMPAGFQMEEIGQAGADPTLANQAGEPDFARVDEATDEVTAASRRGLATAGDADDLSTDDATVGA